jgi:hypothetical protein
MRIFQENADHFHRLFELLGELALLLIAPSVLQPAQPAMQTAHERLKIVVKTGQIAGESTQFRRVYICLCHITSFESSYCCKVGLIQQKQFFSGRDPRRSALRPVSNFTGIVNRPPQLKIYI